MSGLVSLAAGLGLLWRRTAALAGGALTALLLVWMLVFKAPAIVAAPGVAAAWESCGETAVLAAGAWVLFAQSAGGRRAARSSQATAALRLARVLYGLAMLAFGAAHLAYVKETAALVPGWLPAHVAWVCFTGVAYIAAGRGDPRRRVGAAGGDAVGRADGPLHAAGLGAGRGGAGRGRGCSGARRSSPGR